MHVPLSVLEFRDRAELYFRDKVGVIDGDRRLSYGEFGRRTHQLAGALRGLGIRPGDRVSFLTYNTYHLLEAYFGVLEAGAILNPINIRLSPDDIAYIVNHSESAVLFFHRDFAGLVERLRPALARTRHLVVLDGEAGGAAAHEYEGLLATGSPDYQPPVIREDDVAELFYTSGTTGKPKGVALTHRSLHLHALYSSVALAYADDSVVLHVVPLFHVNGWGTPHTVTLAGGTHVMLRRFDPASLLALVQQHRVTHLLGVPLIYNALVNFPALGQYDLSSLRLVLTGGAPASPVLIRTIQEKLGVQAMVGYGLTETSPVLTCARPRRHLVATETPGRELVRRSMTGWAIPGVVLRVVDAEGQDVPADGETIGEIVVRSNVVMDGYYRDPEATAAAIRDGWFHTGDMATIDETGDVLIRDRSKDIIISGGENISSVEIENALYAHPDVLECAVVAAPDERWGEIPVALVVAKPGTAPTPDDLVAHCRGRLAGFKVPKQVQLRTELPKGGTGKILKAELREPFWRGQPKRVH